MSDDIVIIETELNKKNLSIILYRYYDSSFVRLNKEISNEFIQGINFYTDDEILNILLQGDNEYYILSYEEICKMCDRYVVKSYNSTRYKHRNNNNKANDIILSIKREIKLNIIGI